MVPSNSTLRMSSCRWNSGVKPPPLSPFLPPTSRPLDEEEARTPLFLPETLEHLDTMAAAPMDSTSLHRSRYLATLGAVITEALLPFLSLFFSVYSVVELLCTSFHLGCVAGALFCFPTILVLLFYVENMLHREKVLVELGLILALGPLLRWLCSVRLLLLRCTQG